MDGNTPPICDGPDAGRILSSSLHSLHDEIGRDASFDLLDKNDLDYIFDEESEGSEEHLDLQPESAGPTSSSDTGPNATEGESLDKEAGESVDEFSSQNNSTEFLPSPQCDTCATTIPMSVREWMGKAIIADTCRESSRDDGDSYLQIAVDLALVLTKHLLELLGTKFDLKIDEIMSDNLMVLVKPEPLA